MCIGRKIDQRTIADLKARLSGGISLVSFSERNYRHAYKPDVKRLLGQGLSPSLRTLIDGMSDPSGSNTAEKVVAASATTLTLPQPGRAEKGFQIRGEAVDDPSTQNTEAKSPTEREKAREDEEWLENPAHPRNWSSTKKWTNMAIVSRSMSRPFLISRSV